MKNGHSIAWLYVLSLPIPLSINLLQDRNIGCEKLQMVQDCIAISKIKKNLRKEN